jgi:hypothetical protein
MRIKKLCLHLSERMSLNLLKKRLMS